MGRAPCCDKQGLRKGPWSPEEDKILVDFIQNNGLGSWRSLPKQAGLLRCGKSCRLRWTNYLRPDIKRGPFTPDEQKSIIQLHGIVGNKWSTIAAQLPGRTDNEIKNYWNTHLKKRLIRMGINPETYAPPSSSSSSPTPPAASDGGDGGTPPSSSVTRHLAQWESARLEAEARHSRESLLFSGASSAAAAAVPTSSAHSAPAESTTDADFFLRMWNSEVGEAFRSKEATSATGTSPDSSSTKCSSSALMVAITKGGEGKRGAAAGGGGGGGGSSVSSGDGERKDDVVDCAKSSVSGCRGGGGVNDEAMGRDGAGADSSSSNEMEEGYTSEETYQMYLNLVGDDMAVGHLFSLFGTDANEEAALDIAFK